MWSVLLHWLLFASTSLCQGRKMCVSGHNQTDCLQYIHCSGNQVSYIHCSGNQVPTDNHHQSFTWYSNALHQWTTKTFGYLLLVTPVTHDSGPVTSVQYLACNVTTDNSVTVCQMAAAWS